MTWRCAAHQPRFAPFHLRFHPLLRPSFGFFFLLPFFFSFCFVIPMLYLLCQRNPTPFPLLFLSSRTVQPRPTDISISTFVVSLSFFQISHYYILQNSTTFLCPLLFLRFRGCKRFLFKFLLDRLSVYETNESESNGLLSRSLLQNLGPCIFDTAALRSHSENCFSG